MWLFLICIQSGLLLWMVRRLKIYQAVVLCCIYVLLMQVTFYIAALDGFGTSTLPTALDVHYYYFDDTMTVYVIIFLLLFASTFGISRNTKDAKIINTQRALQLTANSSLPIATLLGAAALMVICFFLFNWKIVMRNDQYLLMTSPFALNTGREVGTLLQAALSYTSIGIAVVAAVCMATKRYAVLLLLTPILIFLFLFYLSAHSRFASAQAFAFGAILIAAKFRYRSIALFLALTVFLFSLVFALIGRGHGIHGLSTLPESISLISLEDVKESFVFSILNTMQGIFTTGDSLAILADHDIRYRMLSLSPLPSFMDGFQEILECCQIRITPYSPMSAVGEAIRFGSVYLTIYTGTLFILFRKLTLLTKAAPSIYSLLLNMFVFVNFVISNAYPTRNVFRLFILALILTIFAKPLIKAIGERAYKLKSSSAPQFRN